MIFFSASTVFYRLIPTVSFCYFYNTQKYNITTKQTIPPTAAFTYIDFVFKYVASFLYFSVNIDKFWVFVFSSENRLIYYNVSYLSILENAFT